MSIKFFEIFFLGVKSCEKSIAGHNFRFWLLYKPEFSKNRKNKRKNQDSGIYKSQNQKLWPAIDFSHDFTSRKKNFQKFYRHEKFIWFFDLIHVSDPDSGSTHFQNMKLMRAFDFSSKISYTKNFFRKKYSYQKKLGIFVLIHKNCPWFRVNLFSKIQIDARKRLFAFF